MRIILLILFLYFASRLFNLLILPFFTDESSYVYTSMLIKGDLLKHWDLSLNLPTVKPPLFFILTIISEKIFYDPLLAGRIVSVFSGVATLTGLYLLTMKLFDKKSAQMTAILYILSPFVLTYDRLALMDTLMAAFSVWILLMTLKFIEKKKIVYLYLLIILCFLALLTKQSGKFFLLMLPLVPIMIIGTKAFKNVLVLIIISILSYLIYFLLLSRSQYFYFYNNFDKIYINFSPVIAINNLKAVLSWTKSYFPFIYLLIPFSIVYVSIKRLRAGLALIFWALTPVLISILVGQYFFPRYLLPSIVLIFPVLGLLINKYLILLLAVIPCLIFDYYILINPPKAPYHYNERDQFISGWPAGYGVKEAYAKILSLNKSPVVLVEGDNGHLYSSFKLMGAEFQMLALKQNLSAEEILKNAKENNADYLLTNRKNDIIGPNFLLLWNYQKPVGGVFINLYEVK